MEPRNRYQGMNSASLCSLAGRYDNPVPLRYLGPIISLKIPAQEIQSVMLVFRLRFVNYCPSNLLSGSPPPSLPLSQSQSTVYTDCMWLGGSVGVAELCWRQYSPGVKLFFWPDSEPTKLLYHPKQKLKRVGGLRQINTCRKVPLQVHCFR